MAGNPRVFGLVEEMLDSGKTPEEVCRDCPELLSEVRQRWEEFRRIDAQVEALFPGIRTYQGAEAQPGDSRVPSRPPADGRGAEGTGKVRKISCTTQARAHSGRFRARVLCVGEREQCNVRLARHATAGGVRPDTWPQRTRLLPHHSTEQAITAQVAATTAGLLPCRKAPLRGYGMRRTWHVSS